MIGDINVFQNYSPCSSLFAVPIADGLFSKVARTGSVKLTKELYLSVVLYVSKLDCNLISISKLMNELNCVTKFFPNLCKFQAVDSGKVINSVELCGGLYLLKDNTLLCRQVSLSS